MPTDKMLRQEARAQAQGGRWLEPSDVAKEPEEGYGVTHRTKQTDSVEVREAVVRTKDPAYVEADEKLRQARAQAQGHKFLDASNMPRDMPRQSDTEEFKEAMQRAQSPEFQEERQKAIEAKHHASGGRW